MVANQQQISKGFYQYSQVSDFISVKNYIYLRQNGQKCLMLRFVNDTNFTVDSMKFSVIQLDSSGTVLGQIDIAYDEMKLKSGAMYSADKAIVVDEYCSDFKVVIVQVNSGKYVYHVRDGRPVVSYTLPEANLIPPNKCKRQHYFGGAKVKKIFKQHI